MIYAWVCFNAAYLTLAVVRANIRIASCILQSEHEARIDKVIKCVVLEFKGRN